MSTENTVNNEIFCRNIKIMMAALDIKQKDLAELFGIQKGAVSKIIYGKTPISEKYLVQIAIVYGVSIDWLLLDEGQMKRGEVDPRIVGIFKEHRERELDSKALIERFDQLSKSLISRQESTEKEMKKIMEKLNKLK